MILKTTIWLPILVKFYQKTIWFWFESVLPIYINANIEQVFTKLFCKICNNFVHKNTKNKHATNAAISLLFYIR